MSDQMRVWVNVIVNKVLSLYEGDGNLSNMRFSTEIFYFIFAQGLYTRSFRCKDFTMGL